MRIIEKLLAMVFATSQQVAIEELNNKLLTLNEEAKSIRAAADADKRQLTDQEEQQLQQIFVAFQATEGEIAQRETLEKMENKLAQPAGRRVPPQDPNAPAAVHEDEPRRPARTFTDTTTAKGSWGWRSFGEFALAVRNAPRGKVDPRLVGNAPSPLTSEGAGADGGFTVPPDFRTEIVTKIMAEDSILGRTDGQTTTSNQLTVPVDETTPWQSTGGIQAYWEGEAAQISASKVALNSVTVRAYKLAALVPVTDELLEDASSLANYLRKKTPQKFDFKINDAIINGDGVGKPKGVMASAFKVSVAKELNQTAATVNITNIQKMWSAMYAKWRGNAVWLINQDVEPQLQSLKIEGAASGVFPAYLPPGGYSSSPYATLLGRPIIVTEACQALGTEGDIIFADLSQYLSVTKTGGMRQDVSIHLWFDYDVTAFRFIMRIGGQPWYNTPISRKNSANTLSAFVTLATRS
jgi:HK97 family phage major capsid protein